MTRTGEEAMPITERMAAWSLRHRWVAIGGWFGAVVLAVLVSGLMTGRDAHATDPGESGRAQTAQRRQDTVEPILESVLVQGPHLRPAAGELARTLPGTASTVAPDGRSALVTFQIPINPTTYRQDYLDAVDKVAAVARRYPDTRVVQAGDRSLSLAVDSGVKGDFHQAEYFSFPLTVLILLVVFGALVAAAVPVLLALTTVAGTFGLLRILGHWVPVNSAASSIVLLIGVAVAVDYSLFYLRREREERAAGRSAADAVRAAGRTSGHAILISGLTVMLCVVGLMLTGLDNMRGVSLGALLVVGVAVIGSVTVLPGLLSILGVRVDAGRLPWLGRRTAATESRAWAAIARTVVRRPVLCGGAGAALLVLLALPALGLHLQDAAVTNSLPRSVPAVDNAVRLNQAFPGSATPAHVVIWSAAGADVNTPELRTAIDALRTRVAGPVTVVPVDRQIVLRVPLAGSGTDRASERALARLRNQELPDTVGKVAGVDFAVAGRTAFAVDFAQAIRERLAWVVGFVVVFSLLLLTVAFRSPALAVVSVVLNLLSVGAAWGIVTWVFQDGHFGSVLGFTPYGGVVSWIPLFVFVLLFGLSMDYHIFVVSRVRERDAADQRDRIVGGIATSAGVVTSAALIMTAVFSVFVTLSAIEYKMLGLGMAVAVIIDATLVRGVLLPAGLALIDIGPAATGTPHAPAGTAPRRPAARVP
jgi:putative drug exporter of the RND superfamily